jgi:hypothetical protein
MVFIYLLILFSTCIYNQAGNAAEKTKEPLGKAKSSISGCPIFPSNNIWNTPVDTLPVAANSAQYVNTIGANDNVHADFGSGLWDGGPIGIPFTTVPGSQPKVNVSFYYDDESDAGPYPIPADAPIEGGSGSDGDRHVLVIDRDNCILYELYDAWPNGDGSWSAGSGAIYHLNSHTLRPAGWTSADAAGLPILPGLVRYGEVASGEIDHALRFTAPQTQKKYIWPARHYASSLTGSQYPPMGQRFRLKADFDISGYSAKNQVILRALKKYGMILADNGSSWFISGVPDSRWNNDDLHQLHNVKGSDFEAVNVSSLMINVNSGQANQSGPSKSLAISSPNGGESWKAGSSQEITWTTSGSVGNIKIEYSADNGSSWNTIKTSTANDGSYNWTVPEVSSSNCLVRVSETDGSPTDTSDSVFSIVPIASATITVTSPKGGESWETGSSHSITWTTSSSVGNIKITLLKGGTSLLTVVSSTADDGVYKWTLPNNLSAGSDYRIKISAVTDGSISDTGAAFSVTVPAGAQPEIFLNRSRLNFAAVVPGPATGSQTFWIGNSGSGPLNWTVSTDAGWLDATPASGSGSGKVTVSVNRNGLSTGNYSGTVYVSDASASNSPQGVSVYLAVKNTPGDQFPFGSFDTPLEGSTVRSSIPVTGWALDDVEVSGVRIYLQQGENRLYIGDAVFVEGARPDVKNDYSSYPYHYKGGWGYMLLSNFLPGGGNGNYTLVAVAYDGNGKETLLGSRTINCDNSHAVKPFGAIDTPAQGATVSGSAFINFGWALTPQPNTIPFDGSTIDVYVDGVNIGHPVYNNYREDIATLFPGYANSNGAVGHFSLDTTAYDDGVHTIAWSVRDNGGNRDGVGSRYFNIDNSGNDKSMSRSYDVKHKIEASRPPETFPGQLILRKGFGTYRPERSIYPGPNGIVEIKVKELERLVIHFPGQTRNLTALPVGATLDTSRGVFYWLPGPGFGAEHNLSFLISDRNGEHYTQSIRIAILPKFP